MLNHSLMPAMKEGKCAADQCCGTASEGQGVTFKGSASMCKSMPIFLVADFSRLMGTEALRS
jgi:hypothetical protein